MDDMQLATSGNKVAVENTLVSGSNPFGPPICHGF
jgi:hypothetical protein